MRAGTGGLEVRLAPTETLTQMALADETWTTISPHAVWLSFLRGEWSRIEANNPGVNRRLIAAPDLDSAVENVARLRLLVSVRGPQLERIPSDTEWFQVARLRAEHFLGLRAIGRCGWDHPLHADLNELLRVAARKSLPVQRGIQTLKPILWGHSRAGPFTILEGNHRLTALASSIEQPQIELVTYVGLSSSRCFWHLADQVD